jgi:hypothetical protein
VAFFGAVVSEQVYMLCLLTIKFDPRFSLWPAKEIVLSLLMLTIKTDRG